MKKEAEAVELLPCWNCGREAHLIAGQTGLYYDVSCDTYGCPGHRKVANGFRSPQAAVRAWNRRSTGQTYMDGKMAYSGDVFESQVSGDRMTLKYGTHLAYCPVDGSWMESVGFYAEAAGMPHMPIGCLKDYALKVGTIDSQVFRQLCRYSDTGECVPGCATECNWCALRPKD